MWGYMKLWFKGFSFWVNGLCFRPPYIRCFLPRWAPRAATFHVNRAFPAGRTSRFFDVVPYQGPFGGGNRRRDLKIRKISIDRNYTVPKPARGWRARPLARRIVGGPRRRPRTVDPLIDDSIYYII
jgi:hypothetical protein